MLDAMDGLTAETCAECGFDAAAWRVRDAVSLLDALGSWWTGAVDGVPAEVLNARPEPGVWSVLEYGIHSALVTGVWRERIAELLAEDGASFSAMAPDTGIGEPAVLDPKSVVVDVEREGSALAGVARGAVADSWAHVGRVGEHRVQAEAGLFHAVHDAGHHLMDVGRGLAALGAGTPAHVGRVDQVNASPGGVPKRPVEGGPVDYGGLVGDRQADRKHHGRPFQALCLYSLEVLDELARQGHPIGPGSAGENLTLSGVDWAALRPGARLRIGSVLAEVSFPVTPCAKQSGWFTDGDVERISYERNPQWARWYAWVREPGEVRPGDPVIVQPAEPPRS